MIITTELLRGTTTPGCPRGSRRVKAASRGGYPSSTSFEKTSYDPQAARSFNDPNTYPGVIVGMCDEIAKILRLPDTGGTHSLSGHARPEAHAVAGRIDAIRKLAKDLAIELEEDPIR